MQEREASAATYGRLTTRLCEPARASYAGKRPGRGLLHDDIAMFGADREIAREANVGDKFVTKCRRNMNSGAVDRTSTMRTRQPGSLRTANVIALLDPSPSKLQ